MFLTAFPFSPFRPRLAYHVHLSASQIIHTAQTFSFPTLHLARLAPTHRFAHFVYLFLICLTVLMCFFAKHLSLTRFPTLCTPVCLPLILSQFLSVFKQKLTKSKGSSQGWNIILAPISPFLSLPLPPCLAGVSQTLFHLCAGCLHCNQIAPHGLHVATLSQNQTASVCSRPSKMFYKAVTACVELPR